MYGHDADEHRRGEDVEDGADDQRAENADRHVAARVLRFRAGRRDGLEADVGEEDRRGRRDDAADTPYCPVFCAVTTAQSAVPISPQSPDIVPAEAAPPPEPAATTARGPRRRRRCAMNATTTVTLIATTMLLTNADSDTPSISRPVTATIAIDRRQVHDARADLSARHEVGDRRPRRPRKRRRYVEAEVVQEARDVARPADRDRRGGEAVLEHQQHAHDPGGDLAERRVGVRVRRAGHGDRRRELRIGQRDERAQRAGDDERDHDRRGPRTAPRRGPSDTKMPVPMMQPMPSSTRLVAPSDLLSSPCSCSACICSTDLRAKMSRRERSGHQRAPCGLRALVRSRAPAILATSCDSLRTLH